MTRRPSKNQSGFALLMFVLVIMGTGGLLLIGFSEGMLDVAESKKFEHNKRVLKEAKQALLQFAYNYPVTSNGGPGRLPCADIDNDGDANDNDDADNDVTTDDGECITLGRLPWNEPNLNLYDIRDADGERLWYAVSDAFATNVSGGNIINSDASGTITVRDQSGNVVFDGSNPGSLTQYGIAAVIIAPGAIIDRNGVSQDRSLIDDVSAFDTIADDDPGIVLASNYLDLALGEDNASFTNSNADGFILGPIDNLTNDQFIVITAAEVIEMAEKAAMQAYKTAISDYRVNTSYCEGESPDGAATEAACLAATTPGTWTLGPYPWLYNYAGVTDIADMSSYYPADAVWATEESTNLTTIGRIPSMFGDAFIETDSEEIDSQISGALTMSYASGLSYNQTDCGKSCDSGDITFDNDPPLISFETSESPDDLRFVDIADTVGSDGRLTGTFTAAEPSIILDMYFWHEHNKDPDNDSLTPCEDEDGNGVIEASDCDVGWIIEGDDISVLHVALTLDWPATPGVVNFDMDYTTAPAIEILPATANSHAEIRATFAPGDVINGTMPTVSGGTYEHDRHYHWGDISFDPDTEGTVDAGDFSLDELTLAIRYYPVFPAWAFDNGWHNSMILHYAKGYEPGGTQTCDDGVFNPNTSCIFIRERASGATHARNRDQIAVLLNTGEHGWVDGNTDGDFEDDVDRDSVADAGNREFDYIMRWKDPGDPDESVDLYKVPPGNDNLLILEEL